jgi:hypothetical protein
MRTLYQARENKQNACLMINNDVAATNALLHTSIPVLPASFRVLPDGSAVIVLAPIVTLNGLDWLRGDPEGRRVEVMVRVAMTGQASGHHLHLILFKLGLLSLHVLAFLGLASQ